MAYSVLSFGELLWDMLPSGKVLGGAPANFALRVSELGEVVRVCSRVGDDALGKEALSLLRELGLSDDLVQKDPSTPTGTVDVTLSQTGTPSYTINRGVAYDEIELTDELVRFATQANLICYGTLVQRSQKTRETLYSLLEAAQPDAEKFYDVNLRKDCFSADTVRNSLKYSSIFKLNDEEVPVVCELLGLSAMEPIAFLRDAIERFSLNACLVTLGHRGLIAGSKSGQVVYVPGFQVSVTDSIGAGDACSAGFAVEYLRSGELRAAGELGNALGALVSSKTGGMSRVTADELRTIQAGSCVRSRDEALEAEMARSKLDLDSWKESESRSKGRDADRYPQA
ncbi:MAG: carbohydrate kinase [Bdellovibrionales bacterium]|nr:carbohydrate kinase [Bdellovibrionales bacterium]